MNWFKENKFLTGYIAVMVIGVGALGYLVYSAQAHYDEVNESYSSQANELHRLQGLQPFPNSENLSKLQEQKKDYEAAIENLKRQLAEKQLPVKPMTPEEFQDQLRAAVTDFTTKSDSIGMSRPASFYMGFDPYQATPPRAEAAPLLGRELEAIKFILNTIADARAVELRELKREELPEERPDKPKSDSEGRQGKQKGERGEKGPLVKHSVDVVFLCQQPTFQVVLNSIVGAKDQLYIPRVVTVRNEKDKGPSKIDPNANPNSPTPAPQAPGPNAPGNPAPGAPAAPKIVLGDERIEVTLKLEIIDIPNSVSGAGKTALSAK